MFDFDVDVVVHVNYGKDRPSRGSPRRQWVGTRGLRIISFGEGVNDGENMP